MLIGEPVALTPGLGPHDEMFTAAALACAAPLFLALLLALSQPASAATAASAVSIAVSRTGNPRRCIFTLPLLLLESSSDSRLRRLSPRPPDAGSLPRAIADGPATRANLIPTNARVSNTLIRG